MKKLILGAVMVCGLAMAGAGTAQAGGGCYGGGYGGYGFGGGYGYGSYGVYQPQVIQVVPTYNVQYAQPYGYNSYRSYGGGFCW